MGSNEKAIIQTLIYSNLFKFPLTRRELYYYLQNGTVLSLKDFDDTLEHLDKKITRLEDYYCLPSCEQTIAIRRNRTKVSQDKILQAEKITRWLSIVPSVLFIGVSGSVAVGNASQDDDIDLFIITANNSLYISRLLLLLLLQILGKRRKKGDLKPKDKVCLNMLVDESGMAFPKESHDLYTAREIVQVYPLFERGNQYSLFLARNAWTRQFLPHALGRQNKFKHGQESSFRLLSLFEPLAKYSEQLLISREQTREHAEHHLIALHPNDVKITVLYKFQKQVDQYNKYYRSKF